jgi:ribosomal protein S4
MNKYNVFNAIRWKKANRFGTLYQQLFKAKQETRSYHGENLTDTQFKNIFRTELNTVNPLQSAKDRQQQLETPYALQTFVAVERRLDTAVFRALFASSVRQAAQFIRRGAVRVNGVRVRHPSFPLKAGDVFAVEPERALEALGRKKPSIDESVKLVNRHISKFNKYIDKCHKHPETMWRRREINRRRNPRRFNLLSARAAKKNEALNSTNRKEMNEKIQAVTALNVFKSIVAHEPYFIANGTLPTYTTNTQEFDKSLSVIQLVTGKSASKKASEAPETDKANAEVPQATQEQASEERIKELTGQYFGDTASAGNRSDVKKLIQGIIQLRQEDIRHEHMARMRRVGEIPKEKYDPNWVSRLPAKVPLVDANAAKENMESILPIRLPFGQGKLYGLADQSKPYFTPWSPRQFIAPFAVLPHHIEVSFATCHAVYMRDPVARPGQSELISPLPLDMHERARMWYYRRRRKHTS